ncbi:Nucleoside-diphosphate-sugar epimerase [Minicystis rosea]|nr:Nucleoside-diphosphate-sugar epimerase [Minicystis rosea]
MLGIGGYHLGKQDDPDESVRLIRYAIDHGVTFLDNCWDYNDGDSEIRMGRALADGYRNEVFLMTKLDGRTRRAAEQQLEQSLLRLRTDHIDLVQIHEVIRPADPAWVFGPDGAIEALVAARKAGKLRFIGFTGHKDPAIHLAMLKAADDHGFQFDTVQMPLNVMDPHYRSFEREVLPELHARNAGVLGMKPLGDAYILQSGVVDAVECLRYTMSLPTSVTITGCDSLPVLKQALATAYDFRPMSRAEVNDVLARTREPGADGRFERYKTSLRHDGTSRHPEWLTGAQL